MWPWSGGEHTSLQKRFGIFMRPIMLQLPHDWHDSHHSLCQSKGLMHHKLIFDTSCCCMPGSWSIWMS